MAVMSFSVNDEKYIQKLFLLFMKHAIIHEIIEINGQFVVDFR